MKDELQINLDKLRQELDAETSKFRMDHRWQPWEDQIIRDYSKKDKYLPASLLATKLKVSVSQIHRRRWKLGIRMEGRTVYPVKK